MKVNDRNVDYAILINTCDAYKDAWGMFFYILKRTWTGKLPAIYVNTESEECFIPDINVITLNSNSKDSSWGQRLIESLQRIDSEYVLMMLEDFYYERPIRVDVINRCLEYMKEDKSILAFQLVPAGEVYFGKSKETDDCYPGFYKRHNSGGFTFIAGPTLWRKEDLIRLTMKSDTPWGWEFFGSRRTLLYGRDVYCWYSWENPVFDYDIEHGGAIHRGKWVGYKMRELQEKYGFKIDFGNREEVEDWIKEGQSELIPPVCKRIPSIIYNRTRPVFDTMYGLIKRIGR